MTVKWLLFDEQVVNMEAAERSWDTRGETDKCRKTQILYRANTIAFFTIYNNPMSLIFKHMPANLQNVSIPISVILFDEAKFPLESRAFPSRTRCFRKCVRTSKPPSASLRSTGRRTASATTSRTRCGVWPGPRTSESWSLSTKTESERLERWTSTERRCPTVWPFLLSWFEPRVSPIHTWPLWLPFGASLLPMTSATLFRFPDMKR